MKTQLAAAAALVCLLAGRPIPAAREEPVREVPFHEDCIFRAGFDHGDLNADVAVGDAAGTGYPADRTPVFRDGVRGRALLAGGGSVRSVSYAAKGNFSYGAPGTLSLWIRPVKWIRGAALPPDPLHPGDPGYKLVTYTPVFFSTPYDGRGYMGIERMTPAYTSQPDSLLFWSQLFTDTPNAGIRVCPAAWADGEWHHIGLTWKGEEITLYADGRRAGSAMLKSRMRSAAHIALFTLCSTTDEQPTLLDEVAIYSRALPDAGIAELHESLGKDAP